MWQLAYTEFYFTDVPWPDFHKEDLIKAIEKYNSRDRRFGGCEGGIIMFKTRLISGILLVIAALLDDHKWRLCALFYIVMYFPDRNAGAL